MKRNGWLSTLSAVALSAAVGSASYGQVSGTVKLEGKAPARGPVAGLASNPDCAKLHKEPVLDETVVVDKEGNLANVIVFLKGAKGPAPKDPVVIDQKNCIYVPHVVSVTVGQQLNAANSDPFLHNVHPLPDLNPQSNNAQPGKTPETGMKIMVPKAAEFFKVKCDVHPWMAAYVGVFDHPYHSVTGEDGVFEIATEGLKDGDYEIGAWHEKYKELKGPKVSVKGGKAELSKPLTFKAAAAAAEPKASDAATAAAVEAGVGTVVLTAAPAKAKGACCDATCDAAKAEKKAVAVKQ
jgi:plastocyanin